MASPFFSGTTALATTSASAVTPFSGITGTCTHIMVHNEGSVAGFISFDAGTSKTLRVTASAITALDELKPFTPKDVRLYRDGGSDMSAVYIEVW